MESRLFDNKILAQAAQSKRAAPLKKRMREFGVDNSYLAQDFNRSIEWVSARVSGRKAWTDAEKDRLLRILGIMPDDPQVHDWREYLFFGGEHPDDVARSRENKALTYLLEANKKTAEAVERILNGF